MLRGILKVKKISIGKYIVTKPKNILKMSQMVREVTLHCISSVVDMCSKYIQLIHRNPLKHSVKNSLYSS